MCLFYVVVLLATIVVLVGPSTPCLKISDHPASNTPNSVCSSHCIIIASLTVTSIMMYAPCRVTWWCNGSERDWWPKGPRIDFERHCQVTILGKLFTHMPLFTNQHNLVPVKGRWCLAAGKVTVGLASHWPCVTDAWFIHLRAQRPEEGRWALRLRPFGVRHLYLTYLTVCAPCNVIMTSELMHCY